MIFIERGNDLSKLHLRSHNHIHVLAHYKEKQKMLRNMNANYIIAIEELFNMEIALRNKIYSQKLQHNALRKTIEEKSIQSGLLDKPIIMFDYDKTTANVEQETANVRALRQKQRLILRTLYELSKPIEKRSSVRYSQDVPRISMQQRRPTDPFYRADSNQTVSTLSNDRLFYP